MMIQVLPQNGEFASTMLAQIVQHKSCASHEQSRE